MIFRYPKYYDKFQCVADRCEDSCCAGWEIDIDDASYEYYSKVKGPFGDRLRNSIKEYEMNDEDVYEKHGFILTEQRRCPFLNEHNLCDLYTELGEDALCDVCTDTPRNYLEYGGQRELSLSTSCGEAGRLLYGEVEPLEFVEREIDDTLGFEETEEEMTLAGQIRLARDEAIKILQNRELSLERRVKNFLFYAEKVQKYLNEDKIGEIEKIDSSVCFYDSTSVDDEVMTVYQCFLVRMRSFSELESISGEWEQMLSFLYSRYVESEQGADDYYADRAGLWEEIHRQERSYEYEHMLVYYSFLCLARCVDDYDFLGKAKLVVTSFLMILDMDCSLYAKQKGKYTKQNRIDTARIYAKEVEHSGENLEYLADEFLFENGYNTQNLCVALTFE